MERGESILDVVYEDEDLEDAEDIEMHDVEEGELFENDQNVSFGESKDGLNVKNLNLAERNGNEGSAQRKNKKKRKKKRKRGGSGPIITDINRFVIDVCRRLKERKSYLVWTAVACLGVSALNDLVREVDAIQALGGQKTADGSRHRNGGGILWNIIKMRDPNAYKEIMKRGKEFEKQFSVRNVKQGTLFNKQSTFQATTTCTSTVETSTGVSDVLQKECHVQNHPEPPDEERKRIPVHDRLRIPVAYDDLVEPEAPRVE